MQKTSRFLAAFFVEGETKEIFCVLLRFLYRLFLENEKKTSGKKYRDVYSYQFVAHMPIIGKI